MESPSAWCDAIVRSRPVPLRLIQALSDVPVITYYARDVWRSHFDGAALEARDIQFLAGWSCGLRTTEIAEILGISTYRAKGIIPRIYRKLGARNQAEAVAKAIRRGLI